MRYETKTSGKGFKVWDTKGEVWITKEVPTEKIANEIRDDFNSMEKKDFRPIGMPNFSKK